MHNDVTLIFRVRSSRRKAMSAAIAEALSLLADLDPKPMRGGPLGDQPGHFWLCMKRDVLDGARQRTALLGYTYSVDVVEFLDTPRRKTSSKGLTWSGRPFRLESLYKERDEDFRDNAPDNRSFILRAEDGSQKEIRGYRGDGGSRSRRALPVADARLLANLSFLRFGANFLDPFAGAGGIVVEALRARQTVFTTDNDPCVMHGLTHQGSRHCVADARCLPFPDAFFDSIATEVPFDPEIINTLADIVREISRVLKPAGKAALMVADHQAASVRAYGDRTGFTKTLDLAVNRKGLPVNIFGWTK